MNLQRIKKEIIVYDQIALDLMTSADAGTVIGNLIGQALLTRFQKGDDLDQMPRPFSLWINSLHSHSPTLFVTAYDWLGPYENCRCMELGGMGSHAIKMLMAGAIQAILVTPSAKEAQIARWMAEFLGLNNRLEVVIGIGEQLPFASGTVDKIFGGGVLHHTDLHQSIPEIARVLKPGGRASFTEPRLNWLYKLFENTKIRKMVREPGAQCYPLRISDIEENSAGHFKTSRCVLSGGLMRYGIVILTRGFKIPIPVLPSLWVQVAETRILKAFGLDQMLGGLAVLFEKAGEGVEPGQ